jgi:DNA-binding transcriptional regulator YiaG
MKLKYELVRRNMTMHQLARMGKLNYQTVSRWNSSGKINDYARMLLDQVPLAKPTPRQALREFLAKKDMAPKDLAPHLGVNPRTIQRWCNGTFKTPLWAVQELENLDLLI